MMENVPRMYLRTGLKERVLARKQDDHFPAPAKSCAAPASHIREFCLSLLDHSAQFPNVVREVADFCHESTLKGLSLRTAQLSV